MRRYTVSYAQNREDIILSGFFDDVEHGYYVDVGANDPVHESVTKYFYDKGWHGINIEPIPSMHEKLVAERPRDINLAIGVGSKRGKSTLHYYPHGDGLSTMSTVMAEEYQTKPSEFTSETSELTIDVLSLKQVLKEHAEDTPIHFMKIDVEGFEYEVVTGNDWNKFRPQVICIEANHIEKDWRPFLKQQSYSLVFFDGLNEYYTDNKTDRAKKFDYIKAVIFKEPIANFRLSEDIKEYDKLIKQLESTNHKLKTDLQGANGKLKSDLQEAKKQITLLNQEIDEITPLRRHIKRFIKYRLRMVDGKISKSLTRINNFRPTPVVTNPGQAVDELIRIAQKSDQFNFAVYNKAPRQYPVVLRVYRLSKKVARKSIDRVRKMRSRRG